MAILKKVNGVYQDIGGLSKKVSGVYQDGEAAYIKENGVWVEKWANWKQVVDSNITLYDGIVTGAIPDVYVTSGINLGWVQKSKELGYDHVQIKVEITVDDYYLSQQFLDQSYSVIIGYRGTSASPTSTLLKRFLGYSDLNKQTSYTYTRTYAIPIDDIVTQAQPVFTYLCGFNLRYTGHRATVKIISTKCEKFIAQPMTNVTIVNYTGSEPMPTTYYKTPLDYDYLSVATDLGYTRFWIYYTISSATTTLGDYFWNYPTGYYFLELYDGGSSDSDRTLYGQMEKADTYYSESGYSKSRSYTGFYINFNQRKHGFYFSTFLRRQDTSRNLKIVIDRFYVTKQ